MDVKTTFLNGLLKEEVFVRQPDGFVDPYFPNHVYRLKKSLYGLKQAPRACMDVLKKHEMEKCDTVSTPMATTKLDADLQDIAYATFVCARYQARPTEKHLKEVKRIFRYLRQTINMGLWYLKDSEFELIAYADADHAGCNDDCKSTSGGIQFLGDKLVSWSSKKKNCTAMSSAEAEYVSLSACCAQVIWMRTQLLDYGSHFNKIPIYCDSQSAIAISCNPVFNRCLTRRTSGHDQTKINILQLFHVVINQTNVDYAALLWWDFMNNVFQKKEAIQYPRFIKLIMADLMKKFPNIPKRLEEDYHSIKDDVLLETDDFKEYETVFIKVAVPINQPQPFFSTQGMNRNTPRAHRSPTISANPLETKKKKQTVGESSSPKRIIKKKKQPTPSIPPPRDDRERDAIAEATLLNEESYASAFVDSIFNDEGDDVDDTGKTNVDAEKTNTIVKEIEIPDVSGSQEIRKEQKQTLIPTPIR
ncbi:ribonuclease H-like domain-containing protein [Tanacetum coccineum]